jgi:hypothetical protein
MTVSTRFDCYPSVESLPNENNKQLFSLNSSNMSKPLLLKERYQLSAIFQRYCKRYHINSNDSSHESEDIYHEALMLKDHVLQDVLSDSTLESQGSYFEIKSHIERKYKQLASKDCVEGKIFALALKVVDESRKERESGMIDPRLPLPTMIKSKNGIKKISPLCRLKANKRILLQ